MTEGETWVEMMYRTRPVEMARARKRRELEVQWYQLRSQGGDMGDYGVSLIRTLVPVAVGAAFTWLASVLGIVVDDDTKAPVMAAAVAIVIAVYYAAVRAAERKWPVIGHILLALGMAKAKPTYQGDA